MSAANVRVGPATAWGLYVGGVMVGEARYADGMPDSYVIEMDSEDPAGSPAVGDLHGEVAHSLDAVRERIVAALAPERPSSRTGPPVDAPLPERAELPGYVSVGDFVIHSVACVHHSVDRKGQDRLVLSFGRGVRPTIGAEDLHRLHGLRRIVALGVDFGRQCVCCTSRSPGSDSGWLAISWRRGDGS